MSDTLAPLGAVYESQEVIATQRDDGGFELRRREGGAVLALTHGIGPRGCRMRYTTAWAIMLELDESHRIALELPPCEAVTGGTALCLARADKAATGEVPTPRAPTCWGELVSAELWAMGWLGCSDGAAVRVVLEGET